MKKQNHQAVTDTIEKIEQIIESTEPGKAISISEIAGRIGTAKMDRNMRNATIMLLNKYGVSYTP